MTSEMQTPCFVLEKDKLKANVKAFRAALDARFPSNVLGYSVKTNSMPVLLEELRAEGCYAEVVSHDEYRLARKLGYEPSNIIYNGPLKSRETFLEALAGGAIVNVDSKRELEWLEDLPEGSYKIGLRLNLNLMLISPEDCKDGEVYSRFGFSDENGEFGDALARIRGAKGVKLAGLHLHRTSKTRSLEVYRKICEYALAVIAKYGLEPEYLDLGGGYYGDMPGKPTYDDYVRVMADTLSEGIDTARTTLVVEPGNALIASPFSFYSSVIDTKEIGGDRVVVLDGSRNDVDPFFHKSDYFKTLMVDASQRPSERSQVFVGCTCLENDRLFRMDNAPQMRVGDMVKFSFVGAYTSCLSPLFIRFFPNVYVQEGEELTLARKAWDEDDFLQKHK